MTEREHALLIDRLGFERIVPYDGGMCIRWGMSGGGYATFEWSTETTRNGKQLPVFREQEEVRGRGHIVEKVVERIVEKLVPVVLSTEQIAWALFQTDEEVHEFVRSKGEFGWDNPTTDEMAAAIGRRERALFIAWERNENGWRDRCWERAKWIQAKGLGSRPMPLKGDGK